MGWLTTTASVKHIIWTRMVPIIFWARSSGQGSISISIRNATALIQWVTGANQHALIVNRTNEVTGANGSKQPVPKSVPSSYGFCGCGPEGSVFSFDNPFNGDTIQAQRSARSVALGPDSDEKMEIDCERHGAAIANANG